MVRILAMIVLAAGPLCAAAHGIYIAPRAGSPTLVLGHGAEDLGYDADKVTELRAFDRAGHEVALSREHARRQFSFRLPAETAVVSATYYGGYHGKTADGDWKAGPRGAHAGVARVGEYFKSTLFVAQHAARWPDAQLAIVPLQDVLGLRAGQQLTVRVSFAGRPLAGARVVGDYVNASHQVSAQTMPMDWHASRCAAKG